MQVAPATAAEAVTRMVRRSRNDAFCAALKTLLMFVMVQAADGGGAFLRPCHRHRKLNTEEIHKVKHRYAHEAEAHEEKMNQGACRHPGRLGVAGLLLRDHSSGATRDRQSGAVIRGRRAARAGAQVKT